MKQPALKLAVLGVVLSTLSACMVVPATSWQGRGHSHAHGHGHDHGHGGQGAWRR